MCPPVIFKQSTGSRLDKSFWKCTPVIGISLKHYIQFIDGEVKMEIISDFQGSVTDSVTPSQVASSSHHIKLGQWWQVTYDGGVFSGEVTEVRQNKYKVLVMVPTSK